MFLPHKRTGSLPPDRPLRSGFNPPSREALRDPIQLGVSIVGTTAAFGGAGWWLDTRLHTFPILMIIGAASGLFGIIYLTYKRLRSEDSSTDKPPETRPPEAG